MSTPDPSTAPASPLSADTALVLISQAGAVRQLTLNRPAALNSFTAAMHAELIAALHAAADDASVRCVVLTGSGRGFCAGQDLNEPGMAPTDGQPPDIGAVIERHYRPLELRIQSMPVPVIAARSASFIQAFSKIGLVPDCGGTWLLPRLVGRARAIGLAFTGDKLGAEDAHRFGLIWQCVDDARLADTVQALAQRLAALPSKALAATRHAFDVAEQMNYEAALGNEATLQRGLGRAHDFAEGVAAFQAKRPPRFTDR